MIISQQDYIEYPLFLKYLIHTQPKRTFPAVGYRVRFVYRQIPKNIVKNEGK